MHKIVDNIDTHILEKIKTAEVQHLHGSEVTLHDSFMDEMIVLIESNNEHVE